MRSIDRIYLPGPFGLSGASPPERPKASFAPDFARRVSRKRRGGGDRRILRWVACWKPGSLGGGMGATGNCRESCRSRLVN